MRVIESELGVSVVEDQDASGRTIYRVIRGKESLVPEYSLQDARHLAKVIRPGRVSCHKCKQTDIESFPAELGLGHLRVTGTGGWILERFFGGERDFQDLAFCPDCAKQYHEDCMRWQQQTKQAQEPH